MKRSQAWFIPGMISRHIQWHLRCDMMLEHLEKYGTCNVPQKRTVRIDEFNVVKLGSWLNHQRAHMGQLEPDRLARLQKLVDEGKLSWYLDRYESRRDDAKWDLMYKLMLKYGEEHNGNCNVPSTYSTTLPDGSIYKLGSWLNSQKGYYKTGDSSLTPDRIAKLEKLLNEGRLKFDFRETLILPNNIIKYNSNNNYNMNNNNNNNNNITTNNNNMDTDNRSSICSGDVIQENEEDVDVDVEEDDEDEDMDDEDMEEEEDSNISG